MSSISPSTGSASITVNGKTDSERLEEWGKRMGKFAEQTKSIARFMSYPIVDLKVEDKKLQDYEYDLNEMSLDERGTITHGNNEYCELIKAKYGKAKKSVLCRKYDLQVVPHIPKNARMQAYFSRLAGKRYFLQLYHVFTYDTVLYLFHEPLPSLTLAHKLWELDLSLSRTKQWIFQLAEAVETINLCGIAHRFLRLENILLFDQNRLKISCFDVACQFWSASEQESIKVSYGIPTVTQDYWDHLAPECFSNTYDATMVDSWSIGVIFCLLLVYSTPFDIREPKQMVKQWKTSYERTKMPDDSCRLLLDDIFLEADQRMTVFDLTTEERLRRKFLAESKISSTADSERPYYRIDKPKPLQSQNNIEYQPVGLPNILPSAKAIFNQIGWKTIQSEQTLHESFEGKYYIILRNLSFVHEYTYLQNERYLQAAINGQMNFMVQIHLLRDMPSRYRNVLVKESTRIMKFFGTEQIRQQPKSRHIQAAEAIFMTGDIQKLYIFFPSLSGYRTLHHLVYEIPDFINSTTLSIIMHQLTNTLDFLLQHGICHRYIRAEHIFLQPTNISIVLTHFEMACFIFKLSQNNSVVSVTRSTALQDEKPQMWDHLPPECFQTRYDGVTVDVWSVGVLLLFCLIRKNPFKTPHTLEVALESWNQLKSNSEVVVRLGNHLSTIDRIFVSAKERIRIDELVLIFNGNNKIQSERNLDNPTNSAIQSGKNSQNQNIG
ncbi:hypothetical protein RDWZM_004158 [Blomia tropicalis]|uniref:Protein kinase domain-containing protein n=1 Tax=Blomia tropicalis TaxID=40697 RepID=A0A9Q0MI82_BLOTA|nr:hypothetical protein RDWZM_004158 [Blomia tropicalis]